MNCLPTFEETWPSTHTNLAHKPSWTCAWEPWITSQSCFTSGNVVGWKAIEKLLLTSGPGENLHLNGHRALWKGHYSLISASQPFTQMVMSLPIWGKESVVGTKACISQEVFVLWDFQAMIKTLVVERTVCSTPFPSNEHKGKKTCQNHKWPSYSQWGSHPDLTNALKWERAG